MIQSSNLRGVSPLYSMRAPVARPLLDNQSPDGYDPGDGGGPGKNWGAVGAAVLGLGAVVGIGYVTYTASQNPPAPVQHQVQPSQQQPVVQRPLSEQVRQAPQPRERVYRQPAPVRQNESGTRIDSDGVITAPIGRNTTIDSEGRIESKIGERTSIRSDGTVNVEVSPNVSIRSDGTVTSRINKNMSIRSDGTIEWHFGGR